MSNRLGRSIDYITLRKRLTYQGVWHFVNRYAPEGIEEALSDYEDAYGAPLLEAVA